MKTTGGAGEAGEESESTTGGLSRRCQPAADRRRQQPRTLLQTRGPREPEGFDGQSPGPVFATVECVLWRQHKGGGTVEPFWTINHQSLGPDWSSSSLIRALVLRSLHLQHTRGQDVLVAAAGVSHKRHFSFQLEPELMAPRRMYALFCRSVRWMDNHRGFA
ncbi:hypothetical protein JOB18_032136 [Solea senegalensis]|uniref:Uncharacterized protein n=1 Tax=Solea senegalensis TaxID=28829 RepID=A0AAV6SLG8_SOLSE|nr:hypothetical protein JOB18_032136 [Solea senegalensis]